MSKHGTTLAAIFAEPTRANLKWFEIVALLQHLGAVVKPGRGSRVRGVLNGVVSVFHRPHPQPTVDRGLVRAVRRMLREAGVSHEENT